MLNDIGNQVISVPGQIITGCIMGIIVCLYLSLTDKVDNTYGKRTNLETILLFLLSVGSGVLFSGKCATYREMWNILPVFVNSIMLLITSYMDEKSSGLVSVFPIGVSLFVGITTECVDIIKGNSILKDIWYYLAGIVLFIAFLAVIGLAVADCMIMVSCLFSYIRLYGQEFLFPVLIMLFMASVIFLLRNLSKMFVREKRKQAYPFTACLAIGFLTGGMI